MDPLMKYLVLENGVYAVLTDCCEGATKRFEAAKKESKAFHGVIGAQYSAQSKGPSKIMIGYYHVLAKLFGTHLVLHKLARKRRIVLSASLPVKLKKQARVYAQAQEKLEEHVKDTTYMGSIVLGLNDALVELTGALAGLTLALNDAKLVALAGFITGFAAALSMAISGFLSAKEEAHMMNAKNPLTSAMYTGIAYFITVLFLVAPYIFLPNVFAALACTLTISVLIIASYTWYAAGMNEEAMLPRFVQMAGLSLGVAALSFLLGLVLKQWVGV